MLILWHDNHISEKQYKELLKFTNDNSIYFNYGLLLKII